MKKGSHAGRAIRLAILAGGSAVALAGCAGAKDSGGLTVSDRNAAQLAMNALQTSNIPSTLLGMTSTAGLVPATCRVHLESGHPTMFRVYIFWIPYVGPQAYSWIDMTINKDASLDTFHTATAPSVLPGQIAPGKAAVPGYVEYDRPLTYTLGTQYKAITQGQLHKHAPPGIFSNPGAPCEVLLNGYLRLLPNP